MTRIQNSSCYTEILLHFPRFRSNCRHFSHLDFHACRASISKVNWRHTPTFLPHPNLPLFASGRNRRYICMYSAWHHTGGLPIFPQYRDTTNCCPVSLHSSCKGVYACGIVAHARSLWFYRISPGWFNDMQSHRLRAIWYFAFFLLSFISLFFVTATCLLYVNIISQY